MNIFNQSQTFLYGKAYHLCLNKMGNFIGSTNLPETIRLVDGKVIQMRRPHRTDMT